MKLVEDGITQLTSGVWLGWGQLSGAMPRQELFNTVDGMIGDVS
jgi:hypothetical protein